MVKWIPDKRSHGALRTDAIIIRFLAGFIVIGISSLFLLVLYMAITHMLTFFIYALIAMAFLLTAYIIGSVIEQKLF